MTHDGLSIALRMLLQGSVSVEGRAFERSGNLYDNAIGQLRELIIGLSVPSHDRYAYSQSIS
jgi:hypothetical protein